MNAPEKIKNVKPAKSKANELLAMHGPTGFLIRRLQRYSLLGWGLFFATLCLHMTIVLVSTVASKPVVVVNESGQMVGTIDYLKPSSRSDQEILATSQRFLVRYMSLNSETIFDDYAEAMNLMHSDLQKLTKEALKHDNYLARVAKAKTRSRIIFAQGKDAPVILERHDLDATVRLRGVIQLDGTSERIEKPFDTTLLVRAVARNTNNTAGLVITERRDN
jgi:hypothetical protein